jgi:RHS repeat-associated protein
MGGTILQMGDGVAAKRVDPLKRRAVAQQGSVFSWIVNETDFDAFERPTVIARQRGSEPARVEVLEYNDNTNVWVLGQVKKVSIAGYAPQVENNYDAANATLLSVKKFGVPQATFTYHGGPSTQAGMLASRTDGALHTTYFNNYKRGLAQDVTYPTGSSEHIQVNNLGWITSRTDAAGYVTSYGYDNTWGLITSMTPPGGFTPTNSVFERITSAEYGLPAGHWRHTSSQGNARSITYLDALWRPVMTRIFDNQEEANTRKVVVKAYDFNGRLSFESYPQRDISSVLITSPGTRTQYDALGRVSQIQADSELGVLTTSTAYLSAFTTQTVNPRGKITTQSFWALDDPGAAQLASITAPEGVSVSISRDIFGKPTAITRGGTSQGSNAGYTSGVTRRYVYDAGQRLCKTIEPEVGSTVQVYDAAGNIAWKAPGQSLPDYYAGACNDTSVAASAKISYGYDALNRLTSTSFGDSSPSITRTYTADGLTQSVTSNGSVWTYGYNALRTIATESLSYGGQTYNTAWGYNTAGHLSTLTYPDNTTVSYSPNALGEATGVSGYASGISYHPNGAVNGYALANGIARSSILNLRGLPDTLQEAGVLKDKYTYDANGNITAITDQHEGVFSRTMSYDDLDRLQTASAPSVWGSATYKYDTLDNLRVANVGARSTTINFSSTSNQLSSVVINGGTTNYTFDARGNLSTKGSQTFGFDLGNRLAVSSIGGSYVYDGLGRRVKIVSSDGSTRIQVYSQAGQLLYGTNVGGGRPTSSTTYIYLNGKQIAERQTVGSSASIQYAHVDVLGSPVAHTGPTATLLNRSRFEPYGYVAAGTKPGPNASVIGFTGHVQDPETDLVYMQQRYYDPIAGRFLSVDPVVTDAATGKSFGRYHYVDNNPYRYIDPDGRRLVAVGSEKFRAEVRAAIATIGQGKGGAAIVKALDDSRFTIRIVESRGSNETEYRGTNASNGTGTGSDVRWNPQNTEGGKDSTGSTTRPPVVGLAHELGHAKAISEGKQEPSVNRVVPGTTPASEKQAMEAENTVRREQKVPERPHYYEEKK